jgi:hypothetical protein
MKIVGLLFLLMIARVVHAQEVKHAPTVAQCQADMKLWRAQSKDERTALPYAELYNRKTEMLDCSDIDETLESGYLKVAQNYIFEMGARTEHFIQRHDLIGEFIQEDKAGKR